MSHSHDQKSRFSPIAIVCAIIERQQTFLIARRPEGTTHAGLWELPGGKVHPGESHRDALVREIREELEVDIRVEKALSPVVHEYADFAVELIPFICSVAHGDPVAREHSEIRWIDVCRAGAFQFTDADIPIIKEYAAGRGCHE